MADQQQQHTAGPGSAPPPMSPVITSSGMREYRKGNWTLQETMILIEAKKMDDERRLKRTSTTPTFTFTDQQQQQLTNTPVTSSSQQQQAMEMLLMMRNTTTPTTSSSSNKAVGELRWKWVEDYCWRRGCFRSQNQCNDKWDNLMRDYKKVRDYQRNLILDNQQQQQQLSYWNMEKTERKERGLPSNMLPTIYDAIVQVVEKKSTATSSAPAAAAAPSPASSSASALLLLPPPSTDNVQPKVTTSGALSLLLQQQQMSATMAVPQPPSFSSQPLTIPSALLHQTAPKTIPGDMLDSDTSSDSPAKRRRKEKRPAGVEGGPSTVDIASSMFKITEAMAESERRRDERHREIVMLKQRRLQIEESRMEVNRQGLSRLVDSINTLANSISALAAAASNNNNNEQTQPQPQPQPPTS